MARLSAAGVGLGAGLTLSVDGGPGVVGAQHPQPAVHVNLCRKARATGHTGDGGFSVARNNSEVAEKKGAA